MAGYFAEQQFVAAKQTFDEGMVGEGQKLHEKYCEKCHAEGGKVVTGEEYYLLAGQWTPYLHNALTDFQGGTREVPKKMQKKLEKLVAKEGDKGLAAVLSYYASEQ